MVSVVIPAYNEEQALPHTLRELLRQCGDYEVIVVDGGSTDRTLAVLADLFETIDEDPAAWASDVRKYLPDWLRGDELPAVSNPRQVDCPMLIAER